MEKTIKIELDENFMYDLKDMLESEDLKAKDIYDNIGIKHGSYRCALVKSKKKPALWIKALFLGYQIGLNSKTK